MNYLVAFRYTSLFSHLGKSLSYVIFPLYMGIPPPARQQMARLKIPQALRAQWAWRVPTMAAAPPAVSKKPAGHVCSASLSTCTLCTILCLPAVFGYPRNRPLCRWASRSSDSPPPFHGNVWNVPWLVTLKAPPPPTNGKKPSGCALFDHLVINKW